MKLHDVTPPQGYPDMLPGRCWAFHGVQGTLLISLSHPITLTHVTLDHLPLYNSPTGSIDSAPKDFEVYVSVLALESQYHFKLTLHSSPPLLLPVRPLSFRTVPLNESAVLSPYCPFK